MRFLLPLALAAITLQAQATDVPYSPELDFKQERAVELYVRTRTCYVTAAKAILRQGTRDEEAVLYFMVTSCANAMRAQLHADGMDDTKARAWLVHLARQALYVDVLHQSEPPLN